MQKIHFYKYQGAGNDFIMINSISDAIKFNSEKIQKLCDRRFGIGADGLIFLGPSKNSDFKMIYYNADGKEGTLCGNGGRCAVALARDFGLVKKNTTFEAIDGTHIAAIKKDKISLKMLNVNKIKLENEKDFVLDTGSPHYVKMVDNIENLDVVKQAAALRFSDTFPEGINVNFVKKINDNTFKMRTYERGVEAETFACGTGAVAVALAMNYGKIAKENTIILQAKGGILEVSFEKKETQEYQNIFLKGDAKKVFEGTIIL